MRGDYTLKPLAYEVDNKGVWLVDIVEAPYDKYVGKDRDHGAGLNNPWMGGYSQLMETQEGQQDSHTT